VAHDTATLISKELQQYWRSLISTVPPSAVGNAQQYCMQLSAALAYLFTDTQVGNATPFSIAFPLKTLPMALLLQEPRHIAGSQMEYDIASLWHAGRQVPLRIQLLTQ
jgi:hypothetical protein